MTLYILIGCLYGYSNYRIMTLNEKEHVFPVWCHVVTGVLWPVSMGTMLWIIYKRHKDN